MAGGPENEEDGTTPVTWAGVVEKKRVDCRQVKEMLYHEFAAIADHKVCVCVCVFPTSEGRAPCRTYALKTYVVREIIVFAHSAKGHVRYLCYYTCIFMQPIFGGHCNQIPLHFIIFL